MSDTNDSSKTSGTPIPGAGFLDHVESEIPQLRTAERSFEQIHRILTDCSRKLLLETTLEGVRAVTLETARQLLPCEQIHFFVSVEETEELEIVEAFSFGEIRTKNRFASDQLLLAPVRGSQALPSGVLRFVNKLDWTAFGPDDVALVESFMAPLSLRLETLRLQEGLKSHIHSSIQALASTIEAKDRYTGGHTKRVYAYADAIASELPVTEAERERIRLAGLLHDIGKIGVPDRILLKPSELTELEWVEMRSHTEWGYEIVSRVNGLEEIAEILRHHHERWDGTGYPRGLRETQIPRSSRIIAVADAFDAMVTERPYRKAISPEASREIITRLAGTQFDPWVVEGFERAFEKLRRLAKPSLPET